MELTVFELTVPCIAMNSVQLVGTKLLLLAGSGAPVSPTLTQPRVYARAQNFCSVLCSSLNMHLRQVSLVHRGVLVLLKFYWVPDIVKFVLGRLSLFNIAIAYSISTDCFCEFTAKLSKFQENEHTPGQGAWLVPVTSVVAACFNVADSWNGSIFWDLSAMTTRTVVLCMYQTVTDPEFSREELTY